MSKPTCAAMALYDKHKQYLSAVNRRIVYLEDRRETMGMYDGYADREYAALKYSRELIQKEVIKDARRVIETSQDDREREICQKFLDKWG